MPAVEEKELVTFSAFEGKVDGNTVKGVSIIQEGPALGHGKWVDKKALEQVKKLAAGKGRIKAKLNHWSSLKDTVGYYENFRIKNGKVLADLNLFESHNGKAHLLEMISEMPTSFGVSIMFRGDEPEYDKVNDRYNTRVKELYSADFVDTPAANRDGVFEAEIDKADEDMPAVSAPAPAAFDAAAEIATLKALVEKQATDFAAALEALKPKEPEAPKTPEPDALAAKIEQAIATAFKVHFHAPQTKQDPAPPNEPETPSDKPKLATYAEAKTAFIGTATGYNRTQRAMAFDLEPKNRPEHLRA